VTTNRHLAIALVICVLAPASARGADTRGAPLAEYAVTTWTEKEGLLPGRIRAIAQGFEGYLWLGLETGLVRFDGVRFVPWGGAPMPPVVVC
jgi:ligand-binding sensor domain-containing protein